MNQVISFYCLLSFLPLGFVGKYPSFSIGRCILYSSCSASLVPKKVDYSQHFLWWEILSGLHNILIFKEKRKIIIGIDCYGVNNGKEEHKPNEKRNREYI